MKHGSKMTVTLSMVWIGLMAFALHPEWIRAALGFVTEATHGGAGGSGTNGATSGSSSSGSGGGGSGGGASGGAGAGSGRGYWQAVQDAFGKWGIKWVPTP